MKIRSTLFPAVLSIAFLAFGACSGDDDSPEDVNLGCGSYTTDWQAIANAASVWGQNPTEENCEAYKSALLEFYDDYSDCQFWGNEYQEALEEVQQIDCSGVESET